MGTFDEALDALGRIEAKNETARRRDGATAPDENEETG
jgi:hypothetical protein